MRELNILNNNSVKLEFNLSKSDFYLNIHNGFNSFYIDKSNFNKDYINECILIGNLKFNSSYGCKDIWSDITELITLLINEKEIDLFAELDYGNKGETSFSEFIIISDNDLSEFNSDNIKELIIRLINSFIKSINKVNNSLN